MIASHQFADLFPLIHGEALTELVEDIRVQGLREPIILLNGLILDGRNRYRALTELVRSGELLGDGWGVIAGEALQQDDIDLATARSGIFRAFSPMLDGDPLAYVVSKNLHRRHLKVGQRAMIAAGIANLGEGRPKETVQNSTVSQGEAAQMLGVSRASVAQAVTVRKHGSAELAEAVRDGDVAVSVAEAIAKLPAEKQREVLAQLAESQDGARALKAVAKQVRAGEAAERHQERQVKAEAIAANNPGLPGRTFPFVLIDVPRKHNVYSDATGQEKGPGNHYPVMTFQELCDFPIDAFAAPDAIIAYWSTAASLIDDIDILAEWGFVALRPRDRFGKLVRGEGGEPQGPIGAGRYGSHQIWRKVRQGAAQGMGRWFRDEHEILILARRGDVPAPLPGTQPGSVLEAEVTDHSTKPGELVRAAIDRQWPELAKVEVFARGYPPPGWTFWGNQVTAVVDVAAGPDVEVETVVEVKAGELAIDAIVRREAERAGITGADDDLEIPGFLKR